MIQYQISILYWIELLFDSAKWLAALALVSYEPRVSLALVLCVLLFPTYSRASRAVVLHVPCTLRVPVPYTLRALRVPMLHVLCTICALVPHVSCVFFYFTCLVPCVLWCCSFLVPYVLLCSSSFTCFECFKPKMIICISWLIAFVCSASYVFGAWASWAFEKCYIKKGTPLQWFFV